MNLPGEMRDALGRYGLALALAGLALFLRGVLPLPENSTVFLLPITAVVLSAWHGGRGPGLLASLVSTLGVLYWFIPPVYTFELSPDHALALVMFITLCLLLSEFGARRRRTEHALRAAATTEETLLRESEARMSALAGSADEVVFEFDGKGTYLNVWTSNDALLFLPRHQLIGRTLAEVFDEGWARHHVDRLERVLASGTPEIYEWRIDLPSGRRWFLGRMTSMPSLDGARRTVCCLVRDITQQKRDEANRVAQHGVARALADSDSLADAAPHLLAVIGETMEWDWGAFWIVDRERSRLGCEALWHAPDLGVAALDELGHDNVLTTGQSGPGRVCETAQPDWVENAAEHRDSWRMEVAAHAGLQSSVAFPIFDLRPTDSADRDRSPAPVVAAPAFAVNTGTVEIAGHNAWQPTCGEVLAVIEFFSRHPRERDDRQLAILNVIGGQIGQFLKRRRAEAELRRSEQELRARQEMLDLAQTAARAVAFDWYVGAPATKNRWSPELAAMYGLDPDAFEGTFDGWKKLVHPDDWPSVKLAIERANDSGDIDAEYRVIHRDGTVRWLQAKGRMFLDAAGRPERIVGFMIDGTDRRQVEEQKAKLAAIVESSDDAIISKDTNGIITTWNAGAERIFGYAAQEVIGQSIMLLIPPDRVEEARGILERIRRGERVDHYETVRRRKDSTLLDISLSVSPIIDGSGNVVGASKVARDISERKLAEKTLREREYSLEMARTELAHVSRLTTLGELTASIVHEVSQPLGGMVVGAWACARWLAADPPAMAEARAALDNIVADGRRAREVIARIRALTKRQAPQKQRLDINREITEVLAFTEHELRSHDIVVRTDLDRTLPRLAGDRVQLQQVLLNLIMNAVEAMSAVHDHSRELTIVSRHDGPNAVLVEVRDSGAGLDAQRAEQVFEAFYTTKAEGIGIGLSISRSIIEAHDGRLWAAPNEPHGAVFRFSLPVTGEAVS